MKKFLIFIMVIGMTFTISFAGIIEDAGDTLVKMKIMSGYEDGSLKLEKNITRAEFCTLVVKMLGQTGDSVSDNFKDVDKSHWAYNMVNRAAELHYLSGYDDGTFKPSNNITYAESCAIMSKVLGYGEEFEGKWPENVINKAIELGLDKELENKDHDYKMTRGEISIMLINSMNVKIKKDDL